MSAGNTTSAKQVEINERRVEALKLRKAGKSYREIAETLGVSSSTAHRDVAAALAALNAEQKEHVEDYRDLVSGYVEMARTVVFEIMLSPEGDSDEKLKAVDRWVKLNDQEAKLFGLYKPTQVSFRLDQEMLAALALLGWDAEQLYESIRDKLLAAAEAAKAD